MALLIILLIAGFVALMIVLFACLLLLLRRSLAKKLNQAATTLAPRQIVYSTYKANFFGLASKGMEQLRGNGVLALTQGELAFFMLKPAREVRVPLERIERLERPKWWNGKSVGQKLLAVYFTTEGGAGDAAAFWVPDVAEWTARITELAPQVEVATPGGDSDPSL